MSEDESSTAPRSLERGLLVLECVTREPGGLTFTAIQQSLGLPKMTISRLLNALCALDYLRKDEAGQYRRGPRFAALLDGEPLETRLKRACAGPLRELVQQTANSGLLLVWQTPDLVCLERYLHEESIVLVPPGHVVRNLHLYPAGIFCLPAEHWEAEFAESPGKLEAEGITRGWYEGERERLQARGYTMGHLADRHRLAAPLANGEGAVLGALVIGGTPSSLPEDALQQVGQRLAETARECSGKLRDVG